MFIVTHNPSTKQFRVEFLPQQQEAKLEELLNQRSSNPRDLSKESPAHHQKKSVESGDSEGGDWKRWRLGSAAGSVGHSVQLIRGWKHQ